ncbi:unnamed protein product [Protopolystoma xenopodis]|uniref:Uncharacterized protein n=1 Tax=Protopolystoma xenopodis TaxID=117903 RepID=A0A448WZK4_9PLAT|nr:unnamed protein product [Protopolystoma xenopodis]
MGHFPAFGPADSQSYDVGHENRLRPDQRINEYSEQVRRLTSFTNSRVCIRTRTRTSTHHLASSNLHVHLHPHTDIIAYVHVRRRSCVCDPLFVSLGPTHLLASGGPIDTGLPWAAGPAG